ncbi:hypothetical protein ART_1135 [Arthrobacter sp. PAMC 25486]|nr:hypothetical protein ART_1135 [Arthrobacter sp. PAMC 25486]
MNPIESTSWANHHSISVSTCLKLHAVVAVAAFLTLTRLI